MSRRRCFRSLPCCCSPHRPAPSAQETPEPQTNLADISDEVMCTVCGVPLELALEAPQAEAERDFIRELIAEGQTKEEIKDALVVEYGENVLAVPGTEGFDLAAWLIPIGAFLIAAVTVVFALRRWRRNRAAEPAPAAASPDRHRPAPSASTPTCDATTSEGVPIAELPCVPRGERELRGEVRDLTREVQRPAGGVVSCGWELPRAQLPAEG